jgi:hypothetical protein
MFERLESRCHFSAVLGGDVADANVSSDATHVTAHDALRIVEDEVDHGTGRSPSWTSADINEFPCEVHATPNGETGEVTIWFAITFPHGGYRIECGEMTEDGNELCMSVQAQMWTGPSTCAAMLVVREFHLAPTAAGTYRFIAFSGADPLAIADFAVGSLGCPNNPDLLELPWNSARDDFNPADATVGVSGSEVDAVSELPNSE